MSMSEYFFDSEVPHPIDVVEQLAAHRAWEFDRVADDQIAMSVEGQWRTYSITLQWSDQDETLRLLCTFEMEPPAHRMPQVYDLLNRINDACWAGAFTWWDDQRMMVFRYGLLLTGGQQATAEQIDTMIHVALVSAERYYPAIQLATWGERHPSEAIKVAMSEAYGRA